MFSKEKRTVKAPPGRGAEARGDGQDTETNSRLLPVLRRASPGYMESTVSKTRVLSPPHPHVDSLLLWRAFFVSL